MYRISFDERASRLTLVLSGFWNRHVLEQFRLELFVWLGRYRLAHPRLSILSDCTAYPVQAADVMAGWIDLLGKDMVQVSQPYAIVVGSTLNKLQVQRALDAPNVRCFTDLDTADKWLASRSG